jgi:hypothetical protein
MATMTFHKVSNGLLALGVCASLTAGLLGFGGSAEARVSGPRSSESAQICGWIQDQYDSNLKKRSQYKPGSEMYVYYNNRMINLNGAWHEQQCNTEYGGIAGREVAPVDITTTPLVTSTGGQTAPLTQDVPFKTPGQVGGVLQAD